MERKHDLTDIGNAIAKAMDNPVAKGLRSGIIGVLEIVNPVAGVAVGVGDNILSNYDIYKLSLLLEGLSTGLNLEMQLNELYAYVTSSQEKAINVANLFRKTVNSECPKVCVIYGLILANHIGDDTRFTQDELIVCKALENATEYDLKNFKEIMEKYLKPVSNGNRIVIPEDRGEFIATCDWAVYNRIFISRITEWGDIEEEGDGLNTHYYEAEPALVLMKYMEEVRQIWDYEEKL